MRFPTPHGWPLNMTNSSPKSEKLSLFDHLWSPFIQIPFSNPLRRTLQSSSRFTSSITFSILFHPITSRLPFLGRDLIQIERWTTIRKLKSTKWDTWILEVGDVEDLPRSVPGSIMLRRWSVLVYGKPVVRLGQAIVCSAARILYYSRYMLQKGEQGIRGWPPYKGEWLGQWIEYFWKKIDQTWPNVTRANRTGRSMPCLMYSFWLLASFKLKRLTVVSSWVSWHLVVLLQ